MAVLAEVSVVAATGVGDNHRWALVPLVELVDHVQGQLALRAVPDLLRDTGAARRARIARSGRRPADRATAGHDNALTQRRLGPRRSRS